MEGVSVLTLNKVCQAATNTSWRKHNESLQIYQTDVCDLGLQSKYVQYYASSETEWKPFPINKNKQKAKRLLL